MIARRSGARALAALALGLSALVTCRDALGPDAGAGLAPVAVAPLLPSEAAVAEFGLAIDRVRIIVVRPPSDTIVQTTADLPADQDVLDLSVRVPLIAARESLAVTIEALAGALPLFRGTRLVELRVGAAAAPVEIPVTTYVGPGAGVDSIVLLPRAPFISLNDSLRFQVQAFQAGAPVTQFYVAWSSSDPEVPINGFGVLGAPAVRGAIYVRARTPSGAIDSVPVTFVPLPTQLAVTGGTPQTGVVGQTLDVPLEVEVRGSDNLPVGGVSVRFQALSGGVPFDTVLTSDGAGRAPVLVVLGPTAGAQNVQATLPAFPGVNAVTFELTALAGPIAAATSLISVATGTVASGSDALLTLRGKDANGNDVTTGGLPVVFTAATGSGVSTGSIGPTTDNGDGTYSATFTGVLVGTATTIGATIDGQAVTTTLPTISVLPGPISTATSLVAVGTATVASGTATLLTLQGKDAAGNAVTTGGAAVAFTTSVTGVGTLGPTMDQDDGTYSASFTGVSIGSTAIGAVINDAAVTSTPLPTINVVAGAIDSIAVTPLSATLDALGATQQFTAQAFDVNRNPVSGATFTWGTSNGLIASVDNTGLVTAVANGTATITATADGVTGAATLSIAQVVASVTMTPQAQTLNSLNATQQFTAQAFDRLGQSLTPQPTFTWSSLNTLVARVNQAGLATSLANGTSQIIAASGGVADTADLTVQQVVASVSVTPTNVLLGTTEKVQLAAKALDAGGSTVTGVTFMWATNAVLVATVEPTTGLVTAVGLGMADITATTGSTTGIAKVTVELVATATRLVFIQQPPSPVFLGEPFTVQVAAQDNLGRTVAGTSGSVVLIESASSASTVQGTLTQPLVNGVATFTDLFVNGTGSMAIDATAGSLAGTSNLFQVVD